MVRVFCLVLLGSLEIVLLPSAYGQETEVSVDRGGSFEFAEESQEARNEDPQIFTPLSPIIVESDSVRLPEDQELE